MRTIMNDSVFISKGYKISTDKDMLDREMIYRYLDQESYWSKGIPKERISNFIDHSMCFGVYKQERQVGFARLITDKAVFAYLCDVFILKDFRGQGLSKWLLQSILAHPELQGLRRWLLATDDAHGLYSQFGFTPVAHPEKWMGIYRPYN